METWVGWLIGIAVVVGGVFLLPYLAQRTMDDAGGQGAGGGNAFGVLQEIFHPAAHRAEASIVEEQRKEQPDAKGEDEDPVHDPSDDPAEPRA